MRLGSVPLCAPGCGLILACFPGTLGCGTLEVAFWEEGVSEELLRTERCQLEPWHCHPLGHGVCGLSAASARLCALWRLPAV